MNAVVYKQDAAGTMRSLGSGVNISLTLNPEKLPQK